MFELFPLPLKSYKIVGETKLIYSKQMMKYVVQSIPLEMLIEYGYGMNSYIGCH